MNLFDRNGNNLRPAKPAPKDEPAKKPEDFIYMANAKAAARTNVVAVIGERLFQAWWQRQVRRWWRREVSVEKVDGAMRECIRIADRWQDHINTYQNKTAERIHNAEADRAGKAGIILPTWGEVKDHYPAAHTMFPEAP